MSDNTQKKNPLGVAVDRRMLLRGSAALGVSALLQNFMISRAKAAGPIVSPYGAIAPTPDMNTGLNLIQLPPGFQYWSFGWTGDPLTGGIIPTPGLHDGMAVVKQTGANGRKCYLVRNHEVGAAPAYAAGVFQYSPGGGGGTTNLIWDTQKKKLEKAWPSLSGTVRNCAGGLTPWHSWITGEETFSTTQSGSFKHGYQFDVKATGAGANNAKPIKAMGRFSHEACAVDPNTYYIYQTEDGPSVAGDVGSGLYRFIPKKFGPNGYPLLQKGGTLQMLRIVGEPQKNMQFLTRTDPLTVFDTQWVEVSNPDPNVPAETSCFMQGYNKGGASFRRLEGIWYGLDKIYFVSTDGGPIAIGSTAGEGQVWEYDPVNEKLTCIFHAENVADCENPDNLVVTPNGALLLQEDNAGGAINDAERLLVLNTDGEIFTFAKNNCNFTAGGLGPYVRPESGITFSSDGRQNEWAGACFDESGDWLFVNIQTPGITFAITGPWSTGPI